MSRFLLLVLWLTVETALAQVTLQVIQPVTGRLAPTAPQSFQLPLDAGDYVNASLRQQAPTGLAVYAPGGALLRRFPAAPGNGPRGFAFVAEEPGAYRIELSANATEEFELRVDQVLSVSQRLGQPASREDRFKSERIEALRRTLTSDRSSLEAFWAAVAMGGTPLAESIPGDPSHQLVTFLYRGNTATRNVLLISYFSIGRPLADYTMNRLAETDVWYLTVKLPTGTRVAYQVSPNDPLVNEGPHAAERGATASADPLNPKRWNCASGASKYACQSVAELPGAPAQPWIEQKAGTPKGTVAQHSIKSTILNNERGLWVYTPPGYSATNAPNSLLVVFDGGQYLDTVPVPLMLDNLLAASRISSTVAVFVANPSQEARARELPPNPNFAEFLAKELIPWVRANFNVSTDPSRAAIAGSSFGGLAATYAGLRHPELFGNVLAQSASYWWAPDHVDDEADATTETGWLAKQFVQSPKLPVAFYLGAGTFEVDARGRGGEILETTRHMRDVLLAKGYTVHYQQFAGGHDGLGWRATFADGLLALVGSK